MPDISRYDFTKRKLVQTQRRSRAAAKPATERAAVVRRAMLDDCAAPANGLEIGTQAEAPRLGTSPLPMTYADPAVGFADLVRRLFDNVHCCSGHFFWKSAGDGRVIFQASH